MSYDLMVFDTSIAPKQREAFMTWYDEQSEWGEDHNYDDPAVCAPPLRAWFMDMIQTFGAMNGPFSTGDYDSATVSDYSVGRHLIYVAFAWSQAEPAYHTVTRLAAKHQVGFFNASSDKAEVWLPDGNGGLALAHTG